VRYRFIVVCALLGACATGPVEEGDEALAPESEAVEDEQVAAEADESAEQVPADPDDEPLAKPDDEPYVAPLIEATAISDDVGERAGDQRVSASLEEVARSERDPSPPESAPPHRLRLTRDHFEPMQRGDQGALEHLRHLADTWVTGPNRDTLERYEGAYGALQSVERFDVGGKPVDLAVFLRLTPAPKSVSIFTETHHYTVAAFRPTAQGMEPWWALDLSALHPGVLEMDDVQLSSRGVLYANANYQSYAKEVGGQTAFLYAIDAEAGETLWRTPPVRSRRDFVLVGEEVVITGYGFTAEDDHLYAFDAYSGEQLDRLELKTAHEWMRWEDGQLVVQTYGEDYVIDLEVAADSP
jgi:hypothetical protein